MIPLPLKVGYGLSGGMAEPQLDTADEHVRRFLRLCLRARADGDAREALRRAVQRANLDWDMIRRVALAQRLGPLICQALRGHLGVPAEAERSLRDSYYATAARNLILRHELCGALRALRAAQVSVIVLKGAALAETVYAHIALRPMLDVDLLLRQEDLPAARSALAELGYEAPHVEMHRGTTVTYENELALRKPALAEFALDMHWSLFDSPYYQHTLTMDWFWATARPLRIDGVPTLMLGPEATLLHLCGHLWLHHTGEELLWLHDIARVVCVEADKIDWELLLARAQAYQLVLPLRQVLTRLSDEWGAPIPAAVCARLRALQPSKDEARTFQWRTPARRSVAQRFWADVRSMPGWRRRLHFTWTLLFPSPAYMRERYQVTHPVLLPLYYPYRWARGLRSAL